MLSYRLAMICSFVFVIVLFSHTFPKSGVNSRMRDVLRAVNLNSTLAQIKYFGMHFCQIDTLCTPIIVYTNVIYVWPVRALNNAHKNHEDLFNIRLLCTYLIFTLVLVFCALLKLLHCLPSSVVFYLHFIAINLVGQRK